jgi:hypothetical protein
MKTKVVALLFGGMVALLLLLRYLAPSRAGMPVGWIYLAMPITAASALAAMWLVHFGAWWGAKVDGLGQNSGVPAASVAQRLQELANLRASGAISDREYIQRHRQIIAVARTVGVSARANP